MIEFRTTLGALALIAGTLAVLWIWQRKHPLAQPGAVNDPARGLFDLSIVGGAGT